ncbi:hypothetical protein, partial [Microvirga aerophila]|uniref:hypothetical protein n=1 Tax=Microvirga aerophila TaxID=670291 RepID=UPI001AEE6023
GNRRLESEFLRVDDHGAPQRFCKRKSDSPTARYPEGSNSASVHEGKASKVEEAAVGIRKMVNCGVRTGVLDLAGRQAINRQGNEALRPAAAAWSPESKA